MKAKQNIIMLGLLAFVSTLFFSCGNKKEQDKNVTVEYKTETKSVLIISSSPRRGGNSEILCEQFKKGAEEANHQIEMINLNDYDIKFYASAEYTRDVESVVPDDAIRIIRKMAAADVIVLASPVYFHSMTGQMKTLHRPCVCL